jgi:HK97 family phage prohead protease
VEYKSCPVTVKAVGPEDGGEEGVFEAIVAAYNVDSVNDRIVPGAFRDSLAQWKSSGDPVPVLWNHNSDDPDYHIGYVLEAEERPEGLWVKARIDLDEPKSKKIYKLLKGRRCRAFSFGYDILDARPGKKDDGSDVQELHRLGLHEISPVLYPANRATSLLDVKRAMPPELAHGISERMEAAMALTWPETITVQTAKAAERVLSPDQAAAFERLGKALDQLDAEYATAEAETKAAPPGFTPKPIVARIRKLVAAAQALLDAVEPSDSNAEKATPASPAGAPASQVAEQAAPETKSAEPAPAGTASARLRTDLALMELDVASYTI